MPMRSSACRNEAEPVSCTLPVCPIAYLSRTTGAEALADTRRAKARTALKQLAKEYPGSELPHRYLVSRAKTCHIIAGLAPCLPCWCHAIRQLSQVQRPHTAASVHVALNGNAPLSLIVPSDLPAHSATWHNSAIDLALQARLLYHEAACSDDLSGDRGPSSRLTLLREALTAAAASTDSAPASLACAALRATLVVNLLVENGRGQVGSPALQG